jgi:hypothetical protein
MLVGTTWRTPGFMGRRPASRKRLIKPGVTILAKRRARTTRSHPRPFSKGTFAFYSGHDRRTTNAVGVHTDLALHKHSPATA